MDNTEGVFEVGETVPRSEKTVANNITSVSTTSQKVSMVLKITPMINKASGVVRMKIDQKLEDFSERALAQGLQELGVATTVRNIVTSVAVKDRDTIAMGGLIRDKQVDHESKIPLLGDIPVLGWLFKNKSKTVEKVNLLMFLTPRILSEGKTTAKVMKDLLNRRAAHLKDVVGQDDPHAATVKGIYEKAQKQETQAEPNPFKVNQENDLNFEPQFSTEVKEAGKDIEVFDQTKNNKADAAEGNVPDYHSIMQQALGQQGPSIPSAGGPVPMAPAPEQPAP
jgi:Flp pilus assembly secretin CpaC